MFRIFKIAVEITENLIYERKKKVPKKGFLTDCISMIFILFSESLGQPFHEILV